MNYESIYHSICSNRQANKPPGGVYCERHHIIPRCAGGNDEASNMVVLTGREHFVWNRLNNRRNAYLENVKRNPKHYEQL